MLRITSEIAELLGAHAGDGTLYRIGSSIVWELRRALNEKWYYTHNITPLLKTIFDLEIISKFRGDGANGCWGVQTTKKEITELLLSYGFTPGPKSHTVSVPSFVLNANEEVKRAFVRGLFDTDGCLRFDRIKKHPEYTYSRLEFATASVSLSEGLKTLLDGLCFRFFKWRDNSYYKVCIARKKMLNKFMVEIQPKNPKHLKKYSIWKEKGSYPTGT